MAVEACAPIAVVGAGPAGATVARLLALRGKQVTLIDPGTIRTDRLEVLAPSSSGILAALALTDLLRDPIIARPCAGIRRRWISSRIEYDDFFRHPGGPGFVVDRRCFDARLRTLGAEAGATLLVGRLDGAHRTAAGLELQVTGGTGSITMLVHTVVDATGRSCAVARRLGAVRILTERIVAERCGTNLGRQGSQSPVWLDVDALDGIWQYSTSGPDGRRETWVVDRDHRRRSIARTRVNASACCVSPAAGAGWMAVGDAAAAFDPITSQGLINALSSALVAAGAIISAGGITEETASSYANLITATFANSERGRREVYVALGTRDPERGLHAAKPKSGNDSAT